MCRRGVVYVELDEAQTLQRFGDALAGLPQAASVKTLLVNAKYANQPRHDMKQYVNWIGKCIMHASITVFTLIIGESHSLTERAIFIDTPGFDLQQRLSAVERTLRSFARFYSAADLALFLMPADAINTSTHMQL